MRARYHHSSSQSYLLLHQSLVEFRISLRLVQALGLALLWHPPQNLQRYVLKYAYFVPQLYVHSFDLIVVLDLITSLVVIDNLHHFVHHSLKVPRCLPHHPRTQALLAFELKQELLVAEASLTLLVEQVLLVPLEESVQ